MVDNCVEEFRNARELLFEQSRYRDRERLQLTVLRKEIADLRSRVVRNELLINEIRSEVLK